MEGNTLAVVYLSHYCCLQADAIFVKAELSPIHQLASYNNNWSEALKPVGALMVHSALHNQMIKGKWLTLAMFYEFHLEHNQLFYGARKDEGGCSMF